MTSINKTNIQTRALRIEDLLSLPPAAKRLCQWVLYRKKRQKNTDKNVKIMMIKQRDSHLGIPLSKLRTTRMGAGPGLFHINCLEMGFLQARQP
jgi:hypothetical protein